MRMYLDVIRWIRTIPSRWWYGVVAGIVRGLSHTSLTEVFPSGWNCVEVRDLETGECGGVQERYLARLGKQPGPLGPVRCGKP